MEESLEIRKLDHGYNVERIREVPSGFAREVLARERPIDVLCDAIKFLELRTDEVVRALTSASYQ